MATSEAERPIGVVAEGSCPHCGAAGLAPTGEPGVARCADCGRSSLTAGPVRAPAPRRARALRESTARVPGEVPSWPAAVLGVVLTVVLYALLRLGPEGRVAELFLARGWVPYVVTGVSFWALVLLGHRLVRLRREAALLERDWIVTGEDGRLSPDEAAGALDALAAAPEPLPSSFLGRRLARALRHFEARRRGVEVVEFLAAESTTDEGRVEASYALIRVFVWAVPTLGFIGTVIGIGAAVGGFSETLEAASSLEGMKESIGTVTGGLGVAFDTTLLALVMSILIMFPASAVQQAEENLLAEIDDYCADVLVRRLRDAPEAPTGAPPAALDDLALDRLARRLAERLGPDAERGAGD